MHTLVAAHRDRDAPSGRRSTADYPCVTTDLTHPTPADAAPEAPTPDIRSIVLCTVPGAGAEAIAEALEARGMGAPQPWYDVRRVAPDLLARWDVADLDEYVTALHEHHATADGIFGLVLHWHELRRLYRQVAGLRQPTAQRMLEVVEVIAPQPVFVRLRRGDRAAHVDALQAWEQPGAPASDLSASARRTLSTRIDATETVWTQWFDAIGVKPGDVVYEDAVDDPGVMDELVAEITAALTPEA